MKRTFHLLALLCISNIIIAQNPEHKLVLCGNVGFSFAGTIIKFAEELDPSSSITSSVLPAFQGTADYGLTKVISIGAAFSYQQASLSYYDYLDATGALQNFDVTMSRMNIAIRPLFHYANTNKMDFYSGFRIGYKKVSLNLSTDVIGYDFGSWTPFIPVSFQIVLFGVRGYITENIGLNAEFCIGQPHYASVGLSYRL